MLSMTGFGKGEAEFNGIRLTAEISSVNRKQLELRVSAPSELSEFEPLARRLVGEAVSRGAVQLRVSCTSPAGGALRGTVDAALLASLIEAARTARRAAGLDGAVQVEQLMQIPGVVTSALPDTDSPGMAEAYEKAVSAAIAEYQAMRKREGDALKRDLEARENMLESLVAEIEPLVAEINAAIKARLLEKLESEKLPTPADDERLLKEVLFYADKSDVTEEITRLHSHFGQFRRFLEEKKPVGRSLDFLMQELFREITTLGNKAGVPAVSPLVVAFKSESEKLREQIQNVE
ncbi:MAG: YicC family protein [Lentisphaeria bacterium]|nr:YicC family protein [Lentisphaeria bacterium]